LGLRLVKGLRREAAQRLLAARPATGYRNLRELEQRAGLHPADLEALASADALAAVSQHRYQARWDILGLEPQTALFESLEPVQESLDRKSTRLNSSHVKISYAVFCLKKKKIQTNTLSIAMKLCPRRSQT